MALARIIGVSTLLVVLVTNGFAQKQNVVTRTIDWTYRLVQGDSAHPKKRYFFVVPFASYQPETRWLGGLTFSHFFRAKNADSSTTRPSVARVNLSYSQNKQYSIRPMFEVFTHKNKYSLRGSFTYTNFLENYWGIGAQTPESNKELYSFRLYKTQLKLTRKLKKATYLGVQAHYEKMFNLGYSSIGQMQQSGYPGTGGYEVLGIGPVFTLDNRNHIYYPTSGHFVDVSLAFYPNKWFSNNTFNAFWIDARKYWTYNTSTVFAFQVYAHGNSGVVPFRLLGTIGNESYFRGYYQGRYRDLNALTAQVELRKHIWGPAGIVLFTGIGGVNQHWQTMPQTLRPMAGCGLRVLAIPREKINMRFDIAFGQKNMRGFYITLNESF